MQKARAIYYPSAAQQVIPARRLDCVLFIVVFANYIEGLSLGAAEFQRCAAARGLTGGKTNTAVA